MLHFWRAFCSFFLPNATPEQLRLFSDLHSKALSLQSGIMAQKQLTQSTCGRCSTKSEFLRSYPTASTTSLFHLSRGINIKKPCRVPHLFRLKARTTCRSSKEMQAKFGAAS